MNISDVGFFKGKLRSQTFFEVPTDCYCTSQIPLGLLLAYTRSCRTYANFFYLIPILRRFRIKRCKGQAVLHSALFNFTPLVIRGTYKNKQLTNFKPTYTGINRNKYTFCIIQSLELLKNSKTRRVP
jgi:hypothetical protein